MWMTLLAAVLGKIPGMLGEYFTKKGEVAAAQIETTRQIELAKQKAVAELAQAEIDKAKVVLGSTGAWFKYFTFFMWFGPFMIGAIVPSISKEIFDNLSFMPEWYVTSCVTIMFTVWGISVSAPVVSNVFSNIATFFQQRRTEGLAAKIELRKIDRKSYWAAQHAMGRKITQEEVDMKEALFDELDSGGVTIPNVTTTTVVSK